MCLQSVAMCLLIIGGVLFLMRTFVYDIFYFLTVNYEQAEVF